MPESKSLTKLVRPLPKGQITLPAEFRRRLRIDAETILSLTLKEGKIEIVPLRPVPQEGTLREYGDDDIERFLAEDRLDPDTAAKVRNLLGRTAPA
ncbi:MAG: AbrB/MazE/SpoVT family DNA-binding domain-containing protein [Armatimonadota bacterium]|nr:AbrB/MazE/SpoVT family DNA-binding domain-containing protein [Armatimonadota bacterium]